MRCQEAVEGVEEAVVVINLDRNLWPQQNPN